MPYNSIRWLFPNIIQMSCAIGPAWDNWILPRPWTTIWRLNHNVHAIPNSERRAPKFREKCTRKYLLGLPNCGFAFVNQGFGPKTLKKHIIPALTPNRCRKFQLYFWKKLSGALKCRNSFYSTASRATVWATKKEFRFSACHPCHTNLLCTDLIHLELTECY